MTEHTPHGRTPSGPSTAPIRDAIRIVPLRLPASVLARAPGMPAAAAPQLTYRGGALLSACDVVILFWGAPWATGPLHTLAGQLASFFPAVLTGALLDQLAEYSVPQYAIGHGTFSGSVTVTSPAPTATVTDATIRQFLQQQLASNAQLPPPTANRLYFVYLPPGTAVVLGGSQSCTAFCGYHDAITDATPAPIYYAVMPYPGCAGCLGGASVLDALTSTSSHELCEAITDPVPGQGWYDDQHGEIGDICAWQTKQVGAYVVQQEWSNRAGACV